MQADSPIDVKIFIFNTIQETKSHLCCIVLLCLMSVAAWGQTTIKTGAIEQERQPGGIIRLHVAGLNGYSHDVGRPQLPVWRKVMAVSDDWKAQAIHIDSGSIMEIPLDGIRLAATPGPQRKEGEIEPVITDTTIYNHNTYYSLPLISVEELGRKGQQRMVRITAAPISYNPVSGTLRTYSQLQLWIGNETKEYRNTLTDIPLQRYVVIAPTQFQEPLQEFLHWKRQCGYLVTEYYFDSISQRDTLRAYLKKLYHQATPSQPAPTYVLLAGDDQQIASFAGRQHIAGFDLHTTDFYYGEYSGDMLPDAQVGRWPVSDTTQLNAVIAKTLKYEQYRMADNRHLQRVLLVAGKEDRDPAPIVTNGQVNYLKERIIAHDTSIDTLCYYNPTSDTMAADIYAQMDSGVALVSYTAHCQSWGWTHPNLSRTDIDTLSPNGRYFLSINNCCRSNAINNDSFGKHLLRHRGGGAIGVIGATNETLWDEDYYWNVGVQEMLTQQPQYNSQSPGVIDRWIGPVAGDVTTLGQISHAGNWAVEESGSPYAPFYWEIYTLMGDPSLMPYLGIPATQNLTAQNYHQGDCSIAVSGKPYARVGATWGDTLVAVCLLDSNGNGILHNTLTLPDTLLLTATAPFCQPIQHTVVATPAMGARLVATRLQLYNQEGQPITRLTQGETTTLLITVRNVGSDTASNGICTLTANDSTMTAPLGATTCAIGMLAPGTDTLLTYALTTNGCSTNQQQAHIVLHSCIGDTNCNAQPIAIDLLHTELRFGKPQLLQGNSSVAALNANSEYHWQITLYNEGNGDINGLRYQLNDTTEAQTNLLAAGDSLTATYSLQTGDSVSSLTLTMTAHTNCGEKRQAFSYVAKSNIEHFDAGDLLHYPWQGNWTVDSTVAHSGSHAAHSGIATPEAASELTINYTINRRDSLIYWARTACEEGEQLLFLVDGQPRHTIEGTTTWSRQSTAIDAGQHTLTWRYKRDSNSSGGQAWIDDIRLPFGCYWTTTAGYDSIATQLIGIAPIEPHPVVNIRPNPANRAIWIVSDRDAFITIYDITGRQVGNFFAPKETATQYPTHNLRCGVYCVWVQSDKGTTVSRLTISR